MALPTSEAPPSTPNSVGPQEKLFGWVSEGLFIASVPVAGYLLVPAYISGCAGYFHIPTDLLSLKVTAIFSVAGGIWFALLFLACLFVLVFGFWPHSTDSLVLQGGLNIFRRFRITAMETAEVPQALQHTWSGHARTHVSERYKKLLRHREWRLEWAEKVGVRFELPTQPVGLGGLLIPFPKAG